MKTKRKLLTFICCLLMFIALSALWGYQQYFAPNQQVKKQLTNQFGADFFTSFNTEEAGSGSGAESGPTVKDNAKNDNAKNDNATGSSHPVKASETDPTAKDQNQTANLYPTEMDQNINAASSAVVDNSPQSSMQQPSTQEEIDTKYTVQLQKLQSLSMSRLDALYSAAIQEYHQGKKDGTLNRSALAQKYIQAGNMLQGNVDSQFNKIINTMQADLVSHHLSTDIISELKNTYENAKSEKRSQLLAKALNK